jgi:subtilisin family serine protease
VLFRALIAGTLSLALSGPAFAADPRRDEQWGLEMVRAEAAWETSTGVGADVAVIDTGVQFDHRDLGGRLLTGYDFLSDDPIGPGDGDGNGHGTHVTGIIVANRDNDEGITGVAPGAEVLPLRVLSDDGTGVVDDTIRAIDYAIAHDVHVINLSLGDFLPLQSTIFNDPDYAEALERAVAAGIVVVVAAGNDRLPMCQNPDVDGIVCVGAVDNRGMRSLYSSFGEDVDLMAPGGSDLGGPAEDVLSTFTRPPYDSIAGTSQAAPHVAGVAALLVSLGLEGQVAADRIIATTAAGDIVDASAAVEGLAPPTASGSWSTADAVKRRAVRRRGFRVRCTAARPGNCGVVVRHHGRKIARGGGDVPAGIRTVVTAQLNHAGRKTLKRMGQRIRVRVAVTLPGEATRSRRITVRR